MNKHNRSGGFHIAKMIPFEVVGFGTFLAVAPIINGFWAIIAAFVAMYATYSVFKALRAVVRQVPTALGFSDLAAHTTKKVAAKTKTAAQTAVATPKIALN
jgi:hypothetical protein